MKLLVDVHPTTYERAKRNELCNIATDAELAIANGKVLDEADEEITDVLPDPEEIYNKIYPVGTIHTGFAPPTFDGFPVGEWEQFGHGLWQRVK